MIAGYLGCGLMLAGMLAKSNALYALGLPVGIYGAWRAWA